MATCDLCETRLGEGWCSVCAGEANEISKEADMVKKPTTEAQVTVQRDNPDQPLPSGTQGALAEVVKKAKAHMAKQPRLRPEAPNEPTFPIMGPRNRTIRSIPWATAERARAKAERALGIPLERIAALGGLEARELMAFLDPDGQRHRRKATLAELEALIAEQVGDPA